MSNSDWMRGNFKKTPGYVCPPGKKDFPNMSFHGPTVVKSYADGGIVKHGRKDFPDMSFHKPSAVKGYADGAIADNGFFSNLLRRTSTKDTGQDPAPVEDRMKEREEKAIKTQNTTNDLLNTLSRNKSDEKVNTAPAVQKVSSEPAVSKVSSEYRASKDSQDANADPDGKYTVQQYKDNKAKIDETNQRKANTDKKIKELDADRAKREQDEKERLKAIKPAEAVDFVSAPTANITQTAAAAPIVSSPVVTQASRSYVPQSTPEYTSARSAKIESWPKVKLVGNKFVYPADKVMDPYNEGSSGDGVKGYPLRDDDPRWKLPIPKN